MTSRPPAICLGIAGVDRPADAETIRGIMNRIGYKARTLVVNDALVALEAGAGDQPGVVIVAGTGSIAYGRNRSAQAARAGGWGYLIGDEGGGFWIGRSALASVVRQFDGRGPATQLTELVLRHMGLRESDGADSRNLLSRSASAGDRRTRCARAIRRQTTVTRSRRRSSPAPAPSSRRAAASVIARLGMRGEAFPTILAGGIFRGVPSLARDVEARLVGDRPAQRRPPAAAGAGVRSRAPGAGRGARRGEGALLRLTARGHPHLRQTGRNGRGSGAARRRRARARASAGAGAADGPHSDCRLRSSCASCTRRGRVDFARAVTFNLDEFAGVAPSHPGSFRTFMDRHLFDACESAANAHTFPEWGRRRSRRRM